MKFTLLLFLLFPFYKKTGDEVLSIRIIKTQMNVETLFGINCDAFMKAFQTNLDTFYVDSNNKQKKILNLLSKATFLPLTFRSIDQKQH